jgi:glycosyltransferase involved in cell wall biosynthesis
MNENSNLQFSIIIPTHNSCGTLRSCLESIIFQNYPNFEIWFIDAVSSDSTLDIIVEYQQKHKNINYISEPDKGIYDAMNKGINLAKGEWLYFLGSDDTLYDKNVLSEIAKKVCSDGPEIIYGSVMMRGQNQWNLDNVVFDGEYNTAKFIDRNICHQAIFYNKSIFKKNGCFNLKYITSADFDFNLKCYANTQFAYINLIIANFFVGGHSTTVEDKEFYKDRGALLMKYFGTKIFTTAFINARLYIQQAALSAASPLNFFERGLCLLAYLKLKAQAMLTNPTNKMFKNYNV